MKHQALLEVVIWIRISILTVFRASPEFVTAACEHAGGKLLSLVGVRVWRWRAAPVSRCSCRVIIGLTCVINTWEGAREEARSFFSLASPLFWMSLSLAPLSSTRTHLQTSPSHLLSHSCSLSHALCSPLSLALASSLIDVFCVSLDLLFSSSLAFPGAVKWGLVLVDWERQWRDSLKKTRNVQE